MNRPRLWPAYVIAGLLVVALVWIWTAGEEAVQGRQWRVIPTLAAVLLAGILWLFWFVLFSRLPGRLRLSGLLAAVVVVAAAVSLFRIQGLSGDWVPIVAFRWQAPATPAPAPLVAPDESRSVSPARAKPGIADRRHRVIRRGCRAGPSTRREAVEAHAGGPAISRNSWARAATVRSEAWSSRATGRPAFLADSGDSRSAKAGPASPSRATWRSPRSSGGARSEWWPTTS